MCFGFTEVEGIICVTIILYISNIILLLRE